jgi:subtilisin-like proprotein convertase family protein
MRPARPLALVAAAAASLWLAGPAAANPPGGSAAGQLAAKTAAQIDALAQVKAGLSPAQRKVDSKLRAEATMRAGRPLAAGVSRVSTGVTTDKAGLTTVDVKGKVTSALLSKVHALGGRVLGSYPGTGAVRAAVPLASVEALAAAPDVAHVGVAAQAMTSRMGPGPKRVAKDQREAQLRQRVTTALAAAPRGRGTAVTPLVGALASEGDVTHAADQARARFHVSGVGIKVGVLSDGVDSLAASIASGDLPADTEVLPGQAGSGDEGTAMMEIVHDLAPKAKLAFATAFNGPDSFAQNIRDLRAAGCNIIVDDVIYFAESPFQDGPIARAVIDVTNSGALYFSAAGNEQNVDDGTAGNWEGDYVSSGRSVGKFAGDAHDFDPSARVQVLDPLSADSAGVPVTLQWADPLGASGNDYDLYAVDASGNVVAFSNDVQDGNDDPFEILGVPFGTLGLAIVKFSGAARYFQITPFRGRFASRNGLTAYNTPGVTRGHSAVPAAFSVAAAPAHEPFGREIAPGVPNPAGPFPGVYTAAQQSETFTSDGPRRVFYQPDGTPITPGNFTSTGGTVRPKPDITAADGVQTTVPGFDPFFGTSAAAPHAAAIAALVLSGNPGITPAEVRTALTGTAIDIEASGYDRDTGFGIVMANRVLRFTGATPQPFAVAGNPTVTPVTGDGDAFFEPGERADVTVPVTNEGDATARQVSVQLTTTTPGVTIAPAVRGYGNIAVGATKTATPFRVTLAPTYEPGLPISLRMKVSFIGAFSPQTRVVSVPTGQPSDTVTDIAYTGPPVPIPDVSTVGADVSLPVAAGFGRLSRITFSVDGTACNTTVGSTTVGIDHTFVADLVGTLTSPDGTEVVLFANAGGGGNNICRAVFTDAATRSFQTATSADAPFTGNWQPADPLSTVVGSVADGSWTFHVVDTAAVDTGSIRALSLHISGYVH